MAISSLSSLTVAFSSLSFSSHVSSSNKTLYSPWIRHRRTASPLRWNSPTAIASSTTSFPIAAVSGGADVSAEDLEGVNLEKYVKSRLPGGFAAQRLIGTGRRKCAIARVVLQEGTGKFVINYRDAKVWNFCSLSPKVCDILVELGAFILIRNANLL